MFQAIEVPNRDVSSSYSCLTKKRNRKNADITCDTVIIQRTFYRIGNGPRGVDNVRTVGDLR